LAVVVALPIVITLAIVIPLPIVITLAVVIALRIGTAITGNLTPAPRDWVRTTTAANTTFVVPTFCRHDIGIFSWPANVAAVSPVGIGDVVGANEACDN
jgi:hypothetical protein